MLTLRPYQQAAIDAVYRYLRTQNGNPCLVAPTGSGKSLLMSTIAHDAVTKWNGRVLILAHVKELLEQTANTIRRIAPDLPVGVYSAGLNSRDTNEPVIVAGIQSVYKRACELDRFDLIIVDEAHLLPPDDGRRDGRNILAATINDLIVGDERDRHGCHGFFLVAFG